MPENGVNGLETGPPLLDLPGVVGGATDFRISSGSPVKVLLSYGCRDALAFQSRYCKNKTEVSIHEEQKD